MLSIFEQARGRAIAAVEQTGLHKELPIFGVAVNVPQQFQQPTEQRVGFMAAKSQEVAPVASQATGMVPLRQQIISRAARVTGKTQEDIAQRIDYAHWFKSQQKAESTPAETETGYAPSGLDAVLSMFSPVYGVKTFWDTWTDEGKTMAVKYDKTGAPVSPFGSIPSLGGGADWGGLAIIGILVIAGAYIGGKAISGVFGGR
jgi:hypothetical protein